MNTATIKTHGNTGCFAQTTPDNCAFFKRTPIVDDRTGKTRECFFYEDKGYHRAIHFWFVDFYYQSNFAFAKFYTSKAAKDAALAALTKCSADEI